MLTGSDALAHSSVEDWALRRLQTERISDPLRAALSELVDVLEQEQQREHEFFLSVVLRTQARRWEPLQDALLCLAAQTDQDFEVLLMLHNVAAEDEERVRRLAADYPADFAGRLRIHAVTGGGRARPLAAGVEEARGEYIAFFDDDDLLMANWVEAFHDSAKQTPGKVIRANVAVQMNRPERWTNGAEGQRSISLAKPEYAQHFNLLEHLEINRTPFMGFAFPSAFFTLWGERFDESLPVLEDWDVALRAAGLLGVNSTPELTAIYRHWENSQTSYTSHSGNEWQEATDRVRNRMQNAPFLMPANTYDDLVETVERERRLLAEMLDSTFWRATGPFRRGVARVRRFRSKDR